VTVHAITVRLPLGFPPLPSRPPGEPVRLSLCMPLSDTVFGNLADDVRVHLHCDLLEMGPSLDPHH